MSGKEGLEPGAFGTCCSQPSQDCLILISPDVGPKAKFEKLFCKPFWWPWPIACLLRSKRHCCLMNRGCVSGLRGLSQRAWFSLSISLVIFQLSLIILCTVRVFFFFWNEVCPVFKPNNCFWGLAHISGIWMGAVSRLLSFKFTCNMFLFSAPLAHWGLLFSSLKFAA